MLLVNEPTRLSGEECPSTERPNIINYTPEYVINSPYTVLELYEVLKEYKPGEELRELRHIVDKSQIRTEHELLKGDMYAYGATFPTKCCDFLAIDIDNKHRYGGLKKLLNTLIGTSTVERIDVVLSSYSIFDLQNLHDFKNQIKNSKPKHARYNFNLNEMDGKIHIFVKLNGVYDCRGFYQCEDVRRLICDGYFNWLMTVGTGTIRVSEKFNYNRKNDKHSIRDYNGRGRGLDFGSLRVVSRAAVGNPDDDFFGELVTRTTQIARNRPGRINTFGKRTKPLLLLSVEKTNGIKFISHEEQLLGTLCPEVLDVTYDTTKVIPKKKTFRGFR